VNFVNEKEGIRKHMRDIDCGLEVANGVKWRRVIAGMCKRMTRPFDTCNVSAPVQERAWGSLYAQGVASAKHPAKLCLSLMGSVSEVHLEYHMDNALCGYEYKDPAGPAETPESPASAIRGRIFSSCTADRHGHPVYEINSTLRD
jgi:hypothetical protein